MADLSKMGEVVANRKNFEISFCASAFQDVFVSSDFSSYCEASGPQSDALSLILRPRRHRRSDLLWEAISE